MTSVNTPIPFEDWVLSLPRKIDFVSYKPGAGGEFFTALIALSCPKTKHLLQTNEFEATLSGNLQVPKYFSANYKLSNIKPFYDTVSHIMTINEIIKNQKSAIFNSMIKNYEIERKITKFDNNSYYTDDEDVIKSRLEKLYKNIILIKRSHFLLINEDKMNALNSSKYWNILNIDPITLEGRQCVIKSHRYFFTGDITNSKYDKPFNSNVLNFPFFDYMIYEEYDEVKYFLENRYGSELDFDFIDRSLKDYYKRRVAPFLK